MIHHIPQEIALLMPAIYFLVAIIGLFVGYRWGRLGLKRAIARIEQLLALGLEREDVILGLRDLRDTEMQKRRDAELGFNSIQQSYIDMVSKWQEACTSSQRWEAVSKLGPLAKLPPTLIENIHPGMSDDAWRKAALDILIALEGMEYANTNRPEVAQPVAEKPLPRLRKKVKRTSRS